MSYLKNTQNEAGSRVSTERELFASTLDSRYQCMSLIGKGAFGVVAAARDKKSGQLVAIKKLEKSFTDPLTAKRTLRELKIMRLLQHPNILRTLTVELPKSLAYNDIHIVVPLMDADLSTLIRSKQVLTEMHHKWLMFQLLAGLQYMHKANVVHRDIKPKNILVDKQCQLKICDMGLARLATNISKATQMTDYVSTRWYRSPEVLLKTNQYSAAMDMWSVGCVFAELLLRRPLLPGRNSANQIELILELLGNQVDEDLEYVDPSMKGPIRQYSGKLSNKLPGLFELHNPLAVDLLSQMLTFNPEKRITAENALRHPYLQEFNRNCQWPEPLPLTPDDFSFEAKRVCVKEIKELIYEEILVNYATN